MKRPPLHKVLMNFINKKQFLWYKKVSLYQVAEDWSPETVGRTLRTLESEGKLEVDLYKGKNGASLARYKLPTKL